MWVAGVPSSLSCSGMPTPPATPSHHALVPTLLASPVIPDSSCCVLGGQRVMAQVVESLLPARRMQVEFLALACPGSGHYGHLESKLAHGRSLSNE